MKTFVASLIFFALLLGAICWNCIFINSMADEMNRRVTEIPSYADAKDALDSLSAYWEKRHAIASLSVSYEVLYEVEENLSDLRSAAAQNEESDFEEARSRVLVSIRQLRRLEQFSIENIF